MHSNNMKLICLFFALGCINFLYAQQSKTTVHNPVLNLNFADPTVINVHGKYYAYATQARHDDSMVNIQLATSTDLLHWNYIGDVMPQKPRWASGTQDFWAPHVLYDAGLHRYVLFFSGRNNDTAFDKCIGVAIAQKPEGPFVPEDTPLLSAKGFVDIDPMAVADPQTKKKYLFWGSGFQPIRVEEMSNNWMHFLKGGVAKNAVYPRTEKKYTNLIEGAWLDYNNGYYYLYYSGDNCCGEGANYAVMVARSKHITGPYVTLAKAKNIAGSAILEADSSLLAPGHNSIVKDNKGNKWIAYHAMIKNDDGTWDRSKRVLCMSRLVYVNGWPKVMK